MRAVGVARAEAAVASRVYVAGRRVRVGKVRGAHRPSESSTFSRTRRSSADRRTRLSIPRPTGRRARGTARDVVTTMGLIAWGTELATRWGCPRGIARGTPAHLRLLREDRTTARGRWGRDVRARGRRAGGVPGLATGGGKHYVVCPRAHRRVRELADPRTPPSRVDARARKGVRGEGFPDEPDLRRGSGTTYRRSRGPPHMHAFALRSIRRGRSGSTPCIGGRGSLAGGGAGEGAEAAAAGAKTAPTGIRPRGCSRRVV